MRLRTIWRDTGLNGLSGPQGDPVCLRPAEIPAEEQLREEGAPEEPAESGGQHEQWEEM